VGLADAVVATPVLTNTGAQVILVCDSQKTRYLRGGYDMKIVNTVELKNHANQLLRRVRGGQPVVVTHHGKPTAVLIPITEESIEEITFQYSPAFRRLIAEAEADVRAGRVVTWREFLEHERNAKAT
jgi:prevent-host-death family protein